MSITNVAGEFKVGTGALKIDDNDNQEHYVNVANPIADAASNPTITIAAWYNYTNISGNGSDAQNHVWESTPGYSVSFGWIRHPASRIPSGLPTQPTARPSATTGPDRRSAGTWNHVAMVWNPETQLVKYYHNGELYDYRTFPAGALLEEMAGL